MANALLGRLDTDSALARASDAQLEEEVDEAGISQAKKKAQDAAPAMVDHLVEIAGEKQNTPGSRVSAAREVLHQAEGRPATQKEQAIQGGLTIILAEFKLGGGPEETVTIPPITTADLDCWDDDLGLAMDLELVEEDGKFVLEIDEEMDEEF